MLLHIKWTTKYAKLCSIHYAKWYRRTHRDKIAPVSRARYLRNREKLIKQSKEWQRINIKRIIEQHKQYYRKDPERWMLRAKTIKLYGHLLKEAVCEICKIEGIKLQFHHTTEPYQVDKFMIVCPDCHRQIHAKFGKLKQYYPFDKLNAKDKS